MKKYLILILLCVQQLGYAHHNQDHVLVKIDPTLTPPESTSFLWIILGPLAILLIFGLVKGIQRYRREQ